MDSVIPPWLPILCALFAAVARGLTAFGDGVTYQCMWAFVTIFLPIQPDMSGVPASLPHFHGVNATDTSEVIAALEAYRLRKAVLFSSIMQARAVLPRIKGYAGAMMLAGCPLVFVGANLLLTADVAALKILVGIVFLSLSVGQLTGNGIKWMKAKKKICANKVVATPPSNVTSLDANFHSDTSNDGTVVLALSSPSAQASEVDTSVLVGTVQAVDNASIAEVGESHAQQSDKADHPKTSAIPNSLSTGWFPQLSPNMAPRKMLTLLTLASFASGMLSGLFGTGGPPLMLAYSALNLDKDTLRGFSLLGAVYMVIRLGMYTNSAGNVFDMGEWYIYVGIWLAAIAGASFGTYLRKFCNSTAITNMLLVLVFISSALMLGAIKNPEVAGYYALILAVWGTAMYLLWRSITSAGKITCIKLLDRQ